MAIQTFRASAKSSTAKEMVGQITSAQQVADPIYVLAIRFYEAKNYPKALRLMEYLLRSQAPEFKYLRATAIILQADQQLENALNFYQRATSLDSEHDPRIPLGQGQCLVMLKQYEQALPYLEEAWNRLKNPTLSAQVRNELIKTCSLLLERVQELIQQSSN